MYSRNRWRKASLEASIANCHNNLLLDPQWLNCLERDIQCYAVRMFHATGIENRQMLPMQYIHMWHGGI